VSTTVLRMAKELKRMVKQNKERVINPNGKNRNRSRKVES